MQFHDLVIIKGMHFKQIQNVPTNILKYTQWQKLSTFALNSV